MRKLFLLLVVFVGCEAIEEKPAPDPEPAAVPEAPAEPTE